MENFIFENSTKAYFGKKCVSQYLPNLLSQYGSHVILAYGGGSIKRTGIYDEIMGILKAAGKDVVEFSGIMANPTYDKVLEGAALARQHQADLILAVGGGSVMDCCKAVALAAVYDGDIWQDFWAKPGRIEVTPVPLGIVMTTSGTGSEMNGGAVITNEALKIKTGRDYPQLNARFALLDPLYTYTVPKKQMISGAFDSFTHMMETYFSAPDEDNVSDSLNEALMKSFVRNLRKAIANPEDYEARSNLVWASTMAENRILKLGKQCDFQGHILEHALGAFTDCNHGCGLAVLLPVYYRHIEAAGAKKFARFATEVWGFSPEGKTLAERANDGVEALVSFVKEIGLPTTLRELGMTEDQKDLLPKIAATCVASPGSYKHLDGDEILDIFKEAW
ncbi:iron-containing alcohol dehydrogenase [uncultured Megasphaera sp.]|uniref:iron-containing alcohol dehydrogenase n=1 Tax=uncultured Megasphaera sp. TaxID=165188 RepID=UPI002625AC05|nr:iron-containing alcohol dehydrogenase [uncultured Megasphaera sp.]